MGDPVISDCITLRLVYPDPYPGKFAAVFIKREGRDPTQDDLVREETSYYAAETKEYELMTKRLIQEAGIKLEYRDVRRAVSMQMQDPEYNSDYAPYYRWGPDYSNIFPWWIEMREKYSSRSNPLDLTRSDPSTPNKSTKRQNTDLRQTNAGHVRSSPPVSIRPRFLSITGQPKQGPSHQRTQSQSTQSSPRARLQSDIDTKMAKLRAKTAANITNKASPQAPARKPLKRIFEDLTNDSDLEPLVQPKSIQPPTSMPKLPKQPIFARTRSEDSSAGNKRQLSARPSFVRQDSMPSLLDSEDELNDVHISDTRSPPRSSINDKPTTKVSQTLLSPTSTQDPTTTQATVSKSDGDAYSKDCSVQFSEQIHDYIKEAVGDVDDRVHRMFKDVALRTSLWILKNVPGHETLSADVNLQIGTNERNARAVNKSLEDVLDACDPAHTSLSPKAADHCKLLDKQEKERQQALDNMLEKFKQRKRDKSKVMDAVAAMRNDIKEERDACNREEVKKMRKKYGEQDNEKSRSHKGDDVFEEQESRKRKRNVESEEHIDIDMLM